MDATLTDPLVDRVLDRRYAVEARIARGGMASVYLAVDRRLDRRVAVKVMHPGLADDHDFVARFNREARAAASLSHPDVVAVYDQGTDAGHAFLVMEYVPGATLRSVLRERGRLTPGEALAVMDHVLAALGAAHHAGLVHRDVKPENVLITADARVKVADFGLARAIAETTLTGSGGLLLGTVAYLAPEQVERGVSDARTDVYSAGVMLYELLTGRPPFTGDTPIAVAYQRVREPVPAPSASAPGVPPEIDRLVAAATALDPADRPADASVLHTELRAVRDALNLHERVPAVPAVALDAARQVESTEVVREGAPARGGDTQVVPRDVDTEGTAATAATPRPPRSRRLRWPVVAAVVAVITALAGAGGWWLAAGRYVSAPGLLGLSRAAAEAKAHAAGLRIRWLAPVYSDTVKRDLVARQQPGRGDHVTHGALLSLALSRGPETHPVPAVVGKPLDQAKSMITAVHLQVGDVRQAYADTVAKGDVVRSDPAPGTTVHAGTAVSLVVSQGPQPLPVPNVVGMDVQQATSTVTSAGFEATTSDTFSDTVPKGTVISQDPGAGGTAPKGTTIALVVSKGKQLFPVPGVEGQNVDRAVKILQGAGFTAKVYSFPGGPGIVLNQSPGPNSMRPKGTSISLYVF